MSQYSTTAKVIKRYAGKYLDERYDLYDVTWRPYDTSMGEAGWGMVVEDSQNGKLHGINMGQRFPTKQEVKAACRLAADQLADQDESKILPSQGSSLLVPARMVPPSLGRREGFSAPRKIHS